MSPRFEVCESPFMLPLNIPFHVIEPLLVAVLCHFAQNHPLADFSSEVLARSRLREWSELEFHDPGAR